MPAEHRTKVLIIGSGPAGYTAAIYAARANAEADPGRGPAARRADDDHHRRGKLSRLRRRDPGPLAHGADARPGRPCRHADDRRHHRVRSISRAGRSRAIGDSGDIYYRRDADHRHRRPGALARACRASRSSRGFGVSACATCDGFFFRGKEVCDRRRRQHRGRGGDLPHQPRDQGDADPPAQQLRAEKIMQDRLFRNPKIAVVWDSTVDGDAGRRRAAGVTGVGITNIKTGKEATLPATACSSPSATSRRRRCSAASSRSTRKATS